MSYLSEMKDLFSSGNAVGEKKAISQGVNRIIFIKKAYCSYDHATDQPYVSVNFMYSSVPITADGKPVNDPFGGLSVVNRLTEHGQWNHYQLVSVNDFAHICEINGIKPIDADTIRNRATSAEKAELFEFDGNYWIKMLATIVLDQYAVDHKMPVEQAYLGWVQPSSIRPLGDWKKVTKKTQFENTNLDSNWGGQSEQNALQQLHQNYLDSQASKKKEQLAMESVVRSKANQADNMELS